MTGSALLGAVLGAFVFGRVADILGRKSIYVLVAAIMIVGALASALATDSRMPRSRPLRARARYRGGLSGFGRAHERVLQPDDRGRLVGMVFSMQALGLIIGPLVGLGLLSSGISQALSWRLLLGSAPCPPPAVIYLRSQMPESPRFQSLVRGQGERAASEARRFFRGCHRHLAGIDQVARGAIGLREFVTNPRWPSCWSAPPERGSSSITPTTATPFPYLPS